MWDGWQEDGLNNIEKTQSRGVLNPDAITEMYLGTRWRCVVSFTSRSLYPQGKEPLVPIG